MRNSVNICFLIRNGQVFDVFTLAKCSPSKNTFDLVILHFAEYEMTLNVFFSIIRKSLLLAMLGRT